MAKKRQYSTIQIESGIKKHIVNHCDEIGMKISRFMEKLYINYVSGSENKPHVQL